MGNGIAVLVLILAVVFATPVFTLMMLNTLFGLNIELTVGTWFAALWANMLLASKFTKG